MKITKEQILENIDEVKKYIQEIDNKEEEKVVGIEIKNRWTGEVKFTSRKTTFKEACEDNKANLREADMYGANLYEANLRGADMYEADLRGADLREADMYGANLYEANLRGADMYEADLRGADLRGANLREADMYGAKFYGKGGTTKIKKSQIEQFLTALGVIIED